MIRNWEGSAFRVLEGGEIWLETFVNNDGWRLSLVIDEGILLVFLCLATGKLPREVPFLVFATRNRFWTVRTDDG